VLPAKVTAMRVAMRFMMKLLDNLLLLFSLFVRKGILKIGCDKQMLSA
jgi:hypothetical protein